MNIKLSLNEFQKKSIINKLSEFNVIDLVQRMNLDQEVVCCFFFEHQNVIFLKEVRYSFARSSKFTTSDFEDFLSRAHISLKQEIKHINDTVFDPDLSSQERKSGSSYSLAHSLLSQLWFYFQLPDFTTTEDNIFKYDVASICHDRIMDGLDFLDTYKSILKLYSIDEDKILDYLKEDHKLKLVFKV